MYENVSDKLSQLPPEYAQDLLPLIRPEFLESGKTIVVLDDDPTGTQTCSDVTVLLSWREELITEELKKMPSILFILTNSRSLSEDEAVKLALEIGINVKNAVINSGREVIIISRSDSTLRGHFPAEVEAIASALGMSNMVTLLIPAFIEGGRYTIDDIHYIIENSQLVPVSDTPFARDLVFGYVHSDLKEWVEEKTKGKIPASHVKSISLTDVRIGGPTVVCMKLKTCSNGGVCIVNAVSHKDLEVLAKGVMMAEKDGRKFLYRSSATFVPIRAGLQSGIVYVPQQEPLRARYGALIIVGSHVPKTTMQLSWLLAHGEYKTIEVDVLRILRESGATAAAKTFAEQTDRWILSGHDVVIHTSRVLEVGRDKDDSLRVSANVSNFLVEIVKSLTIRPYFIVAKGGITSSDLASKGLSVERASVLGPVIPGVPLWKMDQKSKFPGIQYVVFPGNVGDETALTDVCNRLRNV